MAVVRAWLAAALVLAAAAPAAAARYNNARFGFTLVYPETLLLPRPEAPNGDGRVFRSRSGTASFSVFAADDAGATSPAGIEKAAEATCNGTKPALRVVRPRLVAMSCVHGGLIYYAKVLIGGGTRTSLIAAYPVGERGVWDRVVTGMADTLTPASR